MTNSGLAFSTFTACTWGCVFRSDTPSASNVIFSSPTFEFIIPAVDTDFLGGSFNTGANSGVVGFTDTGWNHVVIVYDGAETGNADRLKLWLNGSQETLSFTGTIPASVDASSTDGYSFGSVASSTFFDGDISDIVWARTADGTSRTNLEAYLLAVKTELTT